MNHLKNCVIALSVIFCSLSASAQYTEQDIYIYIDTYKELSINKMYEYKIPASITIAQGIFESACGKSHLAVDGNNHFGIKCHKEWTGDTILIDDDELQECFRKYEKVEDSYNDHSQFLRTRQRYAGLFELDIMDYPGWARGLKAAGYATNPQYADRLISLIERFHLALLDTIYQQQLQNGYFKNYPDVDPALAVNFSYVEQYGQPILADTPRPTVENTPKPALETQQKNDSSNTNKVSDKNNKLQTKKVKTEKKDKSKKGSQSGNTSNNHSSHHPDKSKDESKQTSNPNNNKNIGGKTEQPNKTVTENKAPASDPKSQTPSSESHQTAPNTPSSPVKTASTQSVPVFTAEAGQFSICGDYRFTERTVYLNNNNPFIIAEEGDTYSKIAQDVQRSEKKIKKFNDITGTHKPQPGEVVYVERKSLRGEKATYTVQENENLHFISQKTGVKLNKLKQYNGISNSSTPLEKGSTVKLR